MDGFRHITPITVRFKDLDLLRHVNNAVIFTYAETARIKYFFDLGLTSLEEGWDSFGLILARIDCNFRVPIEYGQQVAVGSRIVKIGNTSMTLEYRIEADGVLAAAGESILVHFDYGANQKAPIPNEMRATIEAYEQGV